MKVLSLGMGVQSVGIYYMSSLRVLPRCDKAVFIDLGKEREETMQYLEFLTDWADRNNGIEIVIVRRKNLYQDLLNSSNSTGERFASIPAFIKNEDGSTGMLRRQCTNEYKIKQVDKAIRDIMGFRTLRGKRIEIWKGISLDEIDRMSIPQERWKIHVYPLCGYEVGSKHTKRLTWALSQSRNELVNWYLKNGFPVPVKSSCVFCPYHSDSAWRDIKINSPLDFDAAVKVDEAIRNSTKKGIDNPAYLHRSLKPLSEVEFGKDSLDIWGGECSGNCHT